MKMQKMPVSPVKQGILKGDCPLFYCKGSIGELPPITDARAISNNTRYYIKYIEPGSIKRWFYDLIDWPYQGTYKITSEQI